MKPAGYSSNPLWKKLGYKTGLTVFLQNPPADYHVLLVLPAEMTVKWQSAPLPGTSFVHAFFKKLATLENNLATYRAAIARNGVIWISWPKKASGVPTDISESRIRECALALGLVDIKVCAVDATWSGLKLVIRKELR
jgi:hypothetical protein